MMVNEIRERLGKITPGKWKYENSSYAPEIHNSNRKIAKVLYHMGSEDKEVIPNADFIAHAPEDIEFLLSKIDRLTAEKDAALSALRSAVAEYGTDTEQIDRLVRFWLDMETPKPTDLQQMANQMVLAYLSEDEPGDKDVKKIVMSMGDIVYCPTCKEELLSQPLCLDEQSRCIYCGQLIEWII